MITVFIIAAFGAGFGIGYACRSRRSQRHRPREPIGPYWFRLQV
jgi:hypothetical protein